ncbi:YqcI/YcgG family protein [Umezawaea tangerina]|uniref:YqcI/YcgG family protein n=1 Tax=Umezawaea tangerina TaxID=84725 RepID=A0A2T0TG69_9PSEU|nr:YqcI/YcgG family protein [Umezawaea tangerina]PRY44628.1 hypothetical protein CLV43_102193 [Umezawaea tangerina]
MKTSSQVRAPGHPAEARADLLVSPAATPPGSWPVLAAQLFTERMLDSANPFPCVFGVDAVRKETLRYAFIPNGGQRVPVLAEALRQFTDVAESLGRRTSLVCFFEFDPRLDSLDKHREHFWSLLREVSATDSAPWPEDISQDFDDPTWEYSYNSTPMFVVANTPYHVERRSRYFEYFAITFQPRFVFDDLKGGTATGDNARKVIRERLAKYDTAERTPLLGSFGEAGNKEWEQYFLSDDNEPNPPGARCPIARGKISEPTS